MRATEERAKVSQAHLDRSAAIIKSLKGSKARHAHGVKLDGVQRYAFIDMNGHLFAVPARKGSKIGVNVGGWTYSVRAPKTHAELAAVLRHETTLDHRTPRKASSTVALMAAKIVEAAGRGVERRDFRQAGVADDLIDANLDKAMAMARRIDPNVDAALATVAA